MRPKGTNKIHSWLYSRKGRLEVLVREYMNSMAQMYIAQEELTEEEAEEMTEEFNHALAELIPEAKEEFHQFMENIRIFKS